MLYCLWKKWKKIGQQNGNEIVVEEIEMVELGRRDDGDTEENVMETNIVVDVESELTAGTNNLTQVKYPPPPRPSPPPPMPRRSKRKPKSKKK